MSRLPRKARRSSRGQSPATRQDMAKLARQVGIYSIKTEKQIGDLRKDMERWKDEVIGQFHVVAEDIRHDLIGATKDDLQLLKDTDRRHEKRIVRLEQHAGLLAA